MLLRLKYSDTSTHRLAGALIRGSNPESWLEEISRWGMSASELECYVMPESIQSVKAGGLFVCFTATLPAANLLQQPYGRVGERLYLPLNAELHPDMKHEELKAAFLWERQVFHPVIGMVGFEIGNRFNPVSLLKFPSSRGRDWGKAQSGLAGVPSLESIGLDRPPMEDFFKQQEEVGSKSPKEIPGGEVEESSGSKFAKDLQKGALKGMKGFLDGLNKAFAGDGSGGGDGKYYYDPKDRGSAGTGGAGVGGGTGGGGFSFRPGLFSRMQNWLDQRMEDLEEKRKSELERLMDLFESDPDAALKYAIPLGGNYFNRGTAPPSSSLGARPTNFNLGDLGGGKPVDGWQVDGFEAKLRQRYLDAANREIEAGDYRKAAYIHAHLLHNFTAAANVLEQGRFYREAAVLYKDHLKDSAAAAECLERGGLILDAIELHIEMGKREKAADLYMTLKQKGKAEILYQACADEALEKSDFLEAGRLFHDKMDRPEKAMENYLDGWKRESQSEECLVRYLDLYKDHGKSDLDVRLENIYRKETNVHRYDIFFRTLLRQRPKWEGEEVTNTIDEIAIEIISKDASKGNWHSLNSISSFVKDDQMIDGDANRFIQAFRTRPAPADDPKTYTLPQEINWGYAVGLKDSLLAIGIGEAGEICLARVNWKGYIELTRLPGTIGHPGDRLMVDLAVPDLVFIVPETIQKIPIRVLGPGLNFKLSIKLMSVPGYNRDTVAVGIKPDKSTVLLDLEPNEVRSTFHHYDGQGKLIRAAMPSKELGVNFTFLHPVIDRKIRFFDGNMYLLSAFFILSKNNGDQHFGFDSLRSDQDSREENSEIACFPSLETSHEEMMRLAKTQDDSVRSWAISPYAKNLTIAVAAVGGAFVLTGFVPGQNEVDIQYLMDDEFNSDFIEFLPGMFLLIAGPGFIQVYDLMNDKPEFLQYFSIEQPILAIMPTDLRCQFAVFLSTGEVKLFEFDRY